MSNSNWQTFGQFLKNNISVRALIFISALQIGQMNSSLATTLAPSVIGAAIPAVSQIVVGSNTYTVSGGVINQNGVPDTRTAKVVLLLYYNGLIYQQISENNSWWSTTGANWPHSVWSTVWSDPRVESASGTTSPSSTSLVDASKNIYTTVGGKIYQNGVPDTRTGNVMMLLYYKGLIYL